MVVVIGNMFNMITCISFPALQSPNVEACIPSSADSSSSEYMLRTHSEDNGRRVPCDKNTHTHTYMHMHTEYLWVDKFLALFHRPL